MCVLRTNRVQARSNVLELLTSLIVELNVHSPTARSHALAARLLRVACGRNIATAQLHRTQNVLLLTISGARHHRLSRVRTIGVLIACRGAVLRLVLLVQVRSNPVTVRTISRLRGRLGQLIVRSAGILSHRSTGTRKQHRAERHICRRLNQLTSLSANRSGNRNNHVITRAEGGGNLRLRNAGTINALTNNLNRLVQLLLGDVLIRRAIDLRRKNHLSTTRKVQGELRCPRTSRVGGAENTGSHNNHEQDHREERPSRGCKR